MSTLLPQLLHWHHIAYIILDAKQQLLDFGGEPLCFPADVQLEAEDLSLEDLLPEMIGCEDILTDILEGNMPEFVMDNINRHDENGDEIAYINVQIRRDNSQKEPQLLISLSDTSQYARIQQTLTQQRNQLYLLKQKLDDSNQRLEYILERYVPREVAKALMENRLNADLGGQAQEVTILFVDLRDYTRISERQTPEQTIDMLHVFMEITCNAILDFGGVVVNYMGDAVMAIFNAPNPQKDHALRAVQAAISMQVKALNNDNQWGFSFGVGINTGKVLIGNIGSEQYHQYTAVGDEVNVASRICGHARPQEVLIGEKTLHETLKFAKIPTRALAPVTFKGKTKPLAVHTIMY